MVIVYYSLTGQVKRFVGKISKYSSYNIDEYDDSIGEYILITPTHGFGEIPKKVKKFLDIHSANMKGVCASGRQVWKLRGTYCKCADVIHEQYGVPILLKFEMSGNEKDIETLLERIESIEQ